MKYKATAPKLTSHHARVICVSLLVAALLAAAWASNASAASTFTVTNTADDGSGSLRQAITDANKTPNVDGQPDRIIFNINADSTNNNCNRTTRVCTISPSNRLSPNSESSLPAIVEAVVIDGYTQPGASPNTLAVGTNAVLRIELSGLNNAPHSGLFLRNSGSTIRGLVINRFPDHGIALHPNSNNFTGGDFVEGCFIGTDASGTVALPNRGGIIAIQSPNNRIGGASPAARNLISGNTSHGVDIFRRSNENLIQGNLIGTNAAGTAALGNGGQGILLHDSADNVIGGASPAARNVISGNGQSGIVPVTDEFDVASGNKIIGNFIGTDATGAAVLGNGQHGIRIDTPANVVGGTNAGEGNVISGNGASGVTLSSGNSLIGFIIATDNRIVGNFIGTDLTGTRALGNGGAGVSVENHARDNYVGELGDGAGNVISNNKGGGVVVRVARNFVHRNTLSSNGGAGVVVVAGVKGVPILRNTIFSNKGIGIDLGGGGFNPNDPLDLDTGANNLQNFPVLTSAVFMGESGHVTGSLNSAPNRTFKVELFSGPSCASFGSGEARTFLKELTLATSGGGAAALDEDVTDLGDDKFVTATATLLDGSTAVETSELSPCLEVVRVGDFSARVTNLNDDGPGSLRDAVGRANSEGGGVIDFAPGLTGTIALKGGEIAIHPGDGRGLTILGPGGDRVVVNGNSAGRVFNVTSGAVNISRLTITNGSTGTGEGGGGILNNADLTLAGCKIVGNRSLSSGGGGGGVLNLAGGSLTINSCDISSNAAIEGGGVLNRGKLSVTDSNISRNTTQTDGGGMGGGGVLNFGPDENNRIALSTLSNNFGAGGGGGLRNFGRLTLNASTVSENDTNSYGGGVRNDGVLHVVNCTLSGNRALNASGGGLSNDGSTLDLTNSTVSGNRGSRGGGIHNENLKTATVTSSTVAFNGATLGGGVLNDGTLEVRSTIIARNTSDSTGPDAQGTLDLLGGNLIGDTSGVLIRIFGHTTSNITHADPQLDPLLRANGGTTRTHALLPFSPAIDKGDDAVTRAPYNLSTDQRGRPRPGRFTGLSRDPVDIGAFESGFNIFGSVRPALAGVTLTLSGGGSNTRTTTTSASGSFLFSDVSQGNYVIRPQFFGVSFNPPQRNVEVAGNVNGVNFGWSFSGNPADTADATVKALVRVKDSDPAVLVRDATVTLSGPKSEVKGAASAGGEYVFTQLPRDGDYKLVATHPKYTIEPVKCRADNSGADESGGCLLTNLPTDEPTVEFEAVPAPATPPPLDDDFFSEAIVRERFNFGVLTLDRCDSAAGALGAEQSDGQLRITPFASQRPAPCQTSAQSGLALAVEPSAFNGYVTVRDVDLNSLTSISVKADEPLEAPGAHTLFSVGRDNGNFFRIRVGDGSLQNTVSGLRAGMSKRPAADTGPTIFFETNDPKLSSSATFKRDADVFWRLRMEPVASAAGLPLHETCGNLNPEPQRVVLFETSSDGLDWKTRHCAPIARDTTQVAAELQAGLVGSTNTNPGAARFSNYKVADQTRVRFTDDSANKRVTPRSNVSSQEEEVELRRDGAADSGAVVSYEFDQSAEGSLRGGIDFEDCTAGPHNCSNGTTGKVVFKPGSRTASIRLRLNLDGLDAEKDLVRIILKDEDAAGGVIDGSHRTADISIVKEASHPLDRPRFFVTQHYLDFLGRAPDPAGQTHWMNDINSCAGNAQCAEVKTINVSAAFFLSIEFQETGYVAYRFHQVSYGQRPLYEEFKKDAALLGSGVIVGPETGWQTRLETNKEKLLNEWTGRDAFKKKYDPLNSADFVDELYRNAGVTLSTVKRAEIVLSLLTRQTTREEVFAGLLAPKPGTPEAQGAEEFRRAHFTRLFVLMQYFGYLRRDPDEPGYQFWLAKLNNFGGDFQRAEMVKAFLSAPEYRNRFDGAQAAARPAP